jgi:hypothetical protein
VMTVAVERYTRLVDSTLALGAEPIHRLNHESFVAEIGPDLLSVNLMLIVLELARPIQKLPFSDSLHR